MQHEGAYLLGALAAMLSKTKLIGFVGGEKYPSLINIFEGYKHGAKDINPNAKVLSTYLDEWDSPAKGKEVAISQINDGADFITSSRYIWLRSYRSCKGKKSLHLVLSLISINSHQTMFLHHLYWMKITHLINL